MQYNEACTVVQHCMYIYTCTGRCFEVGLWEQRGTRVNYRGKVGKEKIIKDREIPNKKTRILRRFPNQILVGEQRELSRTLV